MPYSEKTAIIAGATGLTGQHLLGQLLNHSPYTKIIALTRKKGLAEHSKLEEHVINFDVPNTYTSILSGEDIFCCLGTTMKKAGSKEAFKKVDFDYPLDLAKAGIQNGVSGFYLVSAMGASAHSLIFYNQIKGQLENALKQLSFARLHIFQPSLLMGKREEYRGGEKIAQHVMKWINPLFIGPIKQYRGIDAANVATAMKTIAARQIKGAHTYSSDEIDRIATSSFV